MYVLRASRYNNKLRISLPATYRFSEVYVIPRRVFEELKSLGRYCSELTLRINSNIVKILISLQYNKIANIVRLLFRKKHVSGYSTKYVSLREDEVDEEGMVVALSPEELDVQIRHIVQGIACYIFCTGEEAAKMLLRTLEALRKH